MHCNLASRTILLLLPLSLSSQAQTGRDVAPLKYWPAPLYWQPGQSETRIRPESVTITQSAQPPTQTGPNSLVFVGMTPCRVADTRAGFGFSGAFGPPSLTGGVIRAFPIQASTTCTIPSNALAYSFNLTVVTSSFLNYLTVWPYGSTQPNASTLNDDLGTVVANAAIIPAGNDSSGSINVFASNNTDLIIDINGYYTTQIVMPAGSASAPSLAFSGNAGTGMYSPITGVVDIVSGGQTSLSVGGVNTAVGYQDLVSNTMGTENTAVGSETLVSNTTGSENTSTGYFSLYSNTTGSYNTANGFFALGSNNGSNNTAYGAETMHANGNGGSNTAIGYQALYSNSSGGQNTVLGFQAGYNIIGDNNIAIGNQGTNTDSGVIRLGTSGMQNSAYIAGIYSVAASGGVPVYINSNGQLGTTTSSRRYKDDIQDMGDASSGLLQLRPVTFRYKQPYADGSKPIDYGLIAEEVAAVYPDLVVKNAEGQIETVQYQKLTPMLLNELQKQGQLIRDLQSRLAALEAQSAGSAR